MKKIYNSYVENSKYTEIFSEDLTLTINYNEEMKSVSSMRFNAEVKVPGKEPYQMGFTTIELLVQLGNNYTERWNPEASMEDYFTIIRKKVCESVFAGMGLSKNEAFKDELFDVTVRTVNVSGGSSYIILRGSKSDEAAAVIEKNFPVKSRERAMNMGLVLEVPFQYSNGFDFSCLKDFNYGFM